MSYSKLKYDLDMMKLQHKHELELLKMQQAQDEKELLNKCTHKYEDGSSAKTFRGDQRDNWYECGICGRNL